MAKITPDDLTYLMADRVALRFQHAAFDQKMEAQGSIEGDAYSLADPTYWYPADTGKAAAFEKNLSKLTDRVLGGFAMGCDAKGGSLLLIRNVDAARRPVRERSYLPPFLTVGAGTEFKTDQLVGKTVVSGAAIEKIFDQDRATSRRAFKKARSALKQDLIAKIQSARQQVAPAAMAGKVRELDAEAPFIVKHRRADTWPNGKAGQFRDAAFWAARRGALEVRPNVFHVAEDYSDSETEGFSPQTTAANGPPVQACDPPSPQSASMAVRRWGSNNPFLPANFRKFQPD